MLLGSPIVDIGGQNLQNSDLKRSIKFEKVLQTSQFFYQKLVFGTILLKFYFKISCTLLSQGHNINQKAIITHFPQNDGTGQFFGW